MNLSDFNNTTYTFNIQGEINDFINVGLLLFKLENNTEKYLISESIFQYNGIEITGYLFPKEKTIFKMNE